MSFFCQAKKLQFQQVNKTTLVIWNSQYLLLITLTQWRSYCLTLKRQKRTFWGTSHQGLKISTHEIWLILITDIWCHNNFYETCVYALFLLFILWYSVSLVEVTLKAVGVEISQLRVKIRQNCDKTDDLSLVR